jgi:hypothetical protein
LKRTIAGHPGQASRHGAHGGLPRKGGPVSVLVHERWVRSPRAVIPAPAVDGDHRLAQAAKEALAEPLSQGLPGSMDAIRAADGGDPVPQGLRNELRVNARFANDNGAMSRQAKAIRQGLRARFIMAS